MDGLAGIVRHLADKDADAAERLVARLQMRAASLGARPLQGRPSPRYDGLRELVVSHTPYVLFYRVTPTRVEVVRVHHSRQKWPPEA